MQRLSVSYVAIKCVLFAFLGGVPALLSAADPDVEGKIRDNLRAVFPDADVTQINMSQIPGMYEVLLGADTLYVSADGRYVLRGDLLDLKERRNLSEDQREVAREDLLSKVPAQETIEFAPANPTHSVFVFTDITCGFCRKFHQNVPELNRLGIAVRYLAYPRSGTGGEVYKDMVSVWCAPDRRQALTDAKLGKPVTQASCANPVKKQFLLGQALGVHGTPAIYLENGKSVGGYVSPQELLHAVQEN